MANNDTEVNFDINVEQALALKKIQEFKTLLADATKNFDVNVAKSKKEVDALAASLQKVVDAKVKLGAPLPDIARAQSQRDSLVNNAYNRASQPTSEFRATQAITQRAIAEITNSTKASFAKITDAIVKTLSTELRTSEEAVQARLRQTAFSANQNTLNNTPQLLAARAADAERRRQDQLYAYQNGRDALNSRNRLNSLNYNGGSDLMAIQGRVMMNYMAVGGIFNAAKSSLAGILELDKELHQFQAISAASNSEMANLKVNLLEISKTVPFTTVEIAKAATTLAQAGLSTQDITKSLGSITMFATATGSDLSQAVDIITSTLTAFNLETGRTADVANIFTAALNMSKLSVDKLVTSMNYIGPTANALGMSLEETTAVLGALSQSGVKASTMGTGLRALLTDLQSPSKKLTLALQAAGLSVEDIDVKTKGFLPVLEKLKNAGFGASEAYQSLEVRSAAAYVALSNNTDLAYNMERSFTLSSAAVQANSTQMESLSNTAKVFGNVLNAAVYAGFSPLLKLLRDIISVATSALGVLTQFPAVLTLIAAAMSALATASALALGGALIRSLTTMLPLFGTFAKGWSGVAVEAAKAGESVGLFSKLTGGLFALISRNPIGLLLTAISAVAVGIYSWKTSTETTADSVDKLRGRVADLQGAADATGQKIVSIDTAIQRLIDHKAELDNNGLMRGAQIDELRNQFHELGLSIKDDTTSVTDLIAALHGLKSTSSALRRDQLAEAVAAKRTEIQGNEQLLNDMTASNANGPWALRDKINGTPWLMSNTSGALAQLFSGAGKDPNLDYYAKGMADRFGPLVGQATRIGLGDYSSVKDDPLAAQGLLANVNELISKKTLDMGGQTDEEKSKTQNDIDLLQKLSEVLTPIVGQLAAIGTSRADLQVLDKERIQAAIQASSAAKTLTAKQDTLKGDFNAKLIGVNGQDLTSEEKIQALESISNWLKTQSQAAIDEFSKEFAVEQQTDPHLVGVDPKQMVQGLKANLDQLQTQLNAQLLKASATEAKLLDAQIRKSQTKQSAELNRWQRQINEAKNDDIFEAAKKGYADFQKSTQEQIVAFYDELIKVTKPDDTDTLERIKQDRADYIERQKAETEEQDRANTAKAQDLMKDSLTRQQDALKENARVTQKSIDDIIAEMKKTSPGAEMNKLLEKVKELNGVLKMQLGMVDRMDIQKSSLELGTPISSAVAGNAKSTIAFLMSLGMSKAGAAAIAGNINSESSFDPTLVGDHGSAHGLAQWRGTRWNELQSYAATNGVDVMSNSVQLQFMLKEMERDNPDLFARLKSGGEDPAVLAKAMMEQFERPNKDPSINHVTDRMNNATSFFNSASNEATQQAIDENDKKISDTVDSRNAAAIKKTSDATIKSMNAKISTLETQARISTDSKSIEDMQKQVEDAHKKIMDAELAKFDAANAKLKTDDPDSFNEQRTQKIDELRQNMNNDLLKVMNEYYKTADDQLDKPVKAQQAKLDAMQAPDMANKYTQMQIQQQQQAIVDAQRAADAQRVLLIEQQIAEVKVRAAAAPEGSDEKATWINQENDLVQRSNDLKQKNLALDQARAQQAPTVAQGIQSATQAWAQQNGILDQMGNSIPLAKQMENTWGQVLDGLSSGFSQFFMDIASGTMSAGDAFKKLGLSVVQMFMQIIAKALANQIIMSLFGGGTGGGSFLQGILGVVGGKATGGAEPAGMATGGQRAAPFRDGVLRKLMPGEFVMRQSAVNAIGVETLNHFNNLGNRQISEGGLGRGRLQAAANSNHPKQPDVNVWVVSPDEKPQMGPNDIVHVVADNIIRRGTLKTLIHTTAKGG